MVWIFFFKQKTAYEMRISDWSSDVCSSDLRFGDDSTVNLNQARDGLCDINVFSYGAHHMMGIDADRDMSSVVGGVMTRSASIPIIRSEEHTSELQSLMRISYAVFCLKKKTYKLNK